MRILKKFSIILLTITMVVGSIFVGNVTNSYASTSYKNLATSKNTLATNARLGDYFYFSSLSTFLIIWIASGSIINPTVLPTVELFVLCTIHLLFSVSTSIS